MALKITTSTTKGDLAKYAQEELGITLDKDAMQRDDMIAAVREEEKAQGIAGAPEDSAAAGASEPKAAPVQVDDYTKIRAVIVIADLPSHDGGETPPDTHIEVGCNGTFYQLKTGVELEVPYGVYDILNNMRQTKYFSDKDPQTGQQRTSSRESLRYPFQLVRLIKPE
ncbi:hypothetical protein [Rheinheimera sp.]|uniref:hypothetical protein n=1 Tax=Rheinheimera sp. TaxID=1869214 RepID=UPI003D27982B